MNSNPVARNTAHAEALERYRISEVTLFRYANLENTINGRGIDYLETQPEYHALVEARDSARLAVEEANPAGKPTKKKAKR